MTSENKEELLYYEPIQVLRNMGYRGMEMADTELAFLCGLIKDYNPKKVVEIGVAAGGTTTVVLQCIKMLGIDTQMISLDLNTDYYRDTGKKTGYLIDEYKKVAEVTGHTLLTGKYAVEYLEKIGDDIDFLILDTVHSLPGELLDFLAFFPFLKQGCVVVLHDISLCHYSNNRQAFATKILLDTIVAEKRLPIRKGAEFPNIGAFVLTQDTGKYIADVFSAFSIIWAYVPCERELQLYRDFYQKYYPETCICLFDKAVQLNEATAKKRPQIQSDEFALACNHLSGLFGKNVYIYGCGHWGKKLYAFFSKCGINLKGYIISDAMEKPELEERIYYLSEIVLDAEKDLIYVGVSKEKGQIEICRELDRGHISGYVALDVDIMYRYLI